jgi:aldose sugar dehydrogenase
VRGPLIGILLMGFALPAAAVPAVDDPNLLVELVVSDLNTPTTMAFIGPDEFLVLEKSTGQVIRVANGVRSLALDLDVESAGERGLLGIAVHPDFGQGMGRDWVYLYYTASKSMGDEVSGGADYENHVDRFEWNNVNHRLVDPVVPIDVFPSPVPTHNGGPLVFGPDGKLYGVNGDGNRSGAAQNNESNPVFDDTGIIFRLNDDGSVPTDNPFYSDNAQDDPEDRYFAYGVRNSFGLAWDPTIDGDLWDTENGPNAYDEINWVPAGFNSGWTDIMGPGAAPAGLVSIPGSLYLEPAYSALVPPAFTGIAFASTNTSLGGAYEGDLFAADYNNGQVYAFDVNAMRDGVASADKVAVNQNELNGFRIAHGFDGGITDLEEGPDGDLYLVAIAIGQVWRIRGAQLSHDLAITSLKSPKKVTFKPDPKLKTLKLALENRGAATETVANQGQLDALIDVDIQSLGGTCAADIPAYSVAPPKSGFPVSWAPGQKLKLGLDIIWECINDEAKTSKGEDHDDFTLAATVKLMDALGETDDDPSNDGCPRAPSGNDKGCGKQATPFRVDLILK